MRVQKLEDFKLWQEAMKLRKMVYVLTNEFPKEEKFNTSRHLRECARNVPGNIAEAFGRFHFLESIQFYMIARGSVNEIKSDIYAALEEKWIPDRSCKEAVKQCDLVIRMINGTIASSRLRRNFTNNK